MYLFYCNLIHLACKNIALLQCLQSDIIMTPNILEHPFLSIFVTLLQASSDIITSTVSINKFGTTAIFVILLHLGTQVHLGLIY